MKEMQKSLWMLPLRDAMLSWQDARRGLLTGALLFTGAAMQCQTAWNTAGTAQSPALSDYFSFAFSGSLPFAAGSGAPFTLPAIWFAAVFFCIHSCALFPFSMMRSMGTGRLLRAKSRRVWWLRMTFLILFWCALYMGIGMTCMTALSVLRFGVCRAGNLSAGAVGTVYLTLCVLSEWQALCSALLSPPAGELSLAVLLVCTSFWDHPLLLPRYAMLVRSSLTNAQGFEPGSGVLRMTAALFALIGIGAVFFQKADILSHNRER